MYNEKIENLISQFNTADDVIHKTQLGISLNKELLGICQYEEGLKYAFSAWELIKDTDNYGLILDCLGWIGVSYNNQSKFLTSNQYFEKCLEYRDNFPEDFYIPGIYSNIASNHHNMFDYYKAADYYLMAVDAMKGIHEGVFYEQLCSALGVVYTETGDYDKAEEWLKKATQLENAQCLYYSNFYLAYLHKRKKNNLLAIRYFKKSIELSKEHDDFLYPSRAYNYIAELYDELGKTDEAIENGKLAIEYAEKTTLVIEILETNLSLAIIYLKMQEYKKAKELFLKCLSLEKDENNEEYSGRLFSKYSDFCFAVKNVKDGHFYKKKYLAIKEKREKEELAKKVEFLENIKK